MEENIDQLCKIAGEFGMRGVRVFLFQEGADAAATFAFREIARLTKGIANSALVPRRNWRSCFNRDSQAPYASPAQSGVHASAAGAFPPARREGN